MHLSSNGNKTIKDRLPAPAGRSFFYNRDTPTIGEIPRQPGTNENPESFRTDKLPEKVKPSHSRNKVNPVCKPLQPILAVYLFVGGGGTLLTLTFHGSALRLRRKRFASPYLHPVLIFLSILGNNLFCV